MASSTTTSKAGVHPVWAPSLRTHEPAERQSGSRDMVTEAAALSLARRRGRCEPNVDTKLANAWLGFYVALTKSSARPAEAATQASTDAVTEASFSEVASSAELSPRQTATEGEPLTSTTSRSIQSWADVSDSDDDEELPTKKRSRRSHRRRRNRRRGKGGSKKAIEELENEECAPIAEESEYTNVEGCDASAGGSEPVSASPPTVPAPPSYAPVGPWSVASNSVAAPALVTNSGTPAVWPFEAPQGSNSVRQGYLPAVRLPTSGSIFSMSPMGTLASTSPTAGQTPSACEASARTPLRMRNCGSPMGHMVPPFGLPANTAMPAPAQVPSFGFPTNTVMQASVQAAYQSNPVLPASPGPAVYTFAPSGQASPAMYMFAGTPCHGQASPAPPLLSNPFGMSSLPAQGFTPSAPVVDVTPFVTVPAMDPTVMWLAGGVRTCDEDLAMRLLAAVPEAYED